MTNINCLSCNKSFFARGGAKTCSSRCRKKLQRTKVAILSEAGFISGETAPTGDSTSQSTVIQQAQDPQQDDEQPKRRWRYALVPLVLLFVGGFLVAGSGVWDQNNVSLQDQQQQSASVKELRGELKDVKDALELRVAEIEQTLSTISVTPGGIGADGAPGADGVDGPIGPAGATGATGATGPAGVGTCANGDCLSLQAASPGVAEVGNSNITGTAIAAFFSGSGASLTSLNGSNISSGTVVDARLSTNVTLQGNSFNGLSQLVQLTAGGILPTLDGSNLTNITGANVTGNISGNAGTASALAANPSDCAANTYATTIAASGNLTCVSITDGSLSANVTLQGNTFNGASQLVQLTAGGVLPVLSGVNLTSLNGSNISSGTVADAHLSTNVTVQGNTFNGASQLIQLTAGGILPVLDGSNITNITGANVVGNISGNAGTATALAANPTDCAANTYATTIAASGNLTCAAITDASLSSNVTLQGNTFNGASQLVQLTAGGILPVLNGSNLTNITGANVVGNISGNAATATALAADPSDCGVNTYATTIAASGNLTCASITDGALSANVTLQGNTFNGASQLVQLTGGGLLPVLDGSNLTALNASNLSSGTVASGRISGSYTGITGTGVLNAGSITSGFGAIDIGADTVTSGLINGQTISSSANFTGSLTVATTGVFNGASVTVGTASATTGTLVLQNATNAFTTTITAPNTAVSSKTITLPNETGTVCTTGSVCSGYASSSGYATISLNNIASTNISAALNKTSGDLALTTTTSGNITVTPFGNTLFSSGNVGIGVAVPGYALHVVTNVAVGNSSGLIWSDVGGTFGNQIVRNAGDGSMYITSGQAHIALMPASNVGVGTVSPGSKLTVVTTSAQTTDIFAVTDSGTGTVTNAVDGLSLTFTQADDGDATDTNAVINLAVTSSSGDADTLQGLNIGNITGGSATERAVQIGSGWDANLFLNDTTTQIQVANTGVITFEDEAGNDLVTITDTGTTGDINFTGKLKEDGVEILSTMVTAFPSACPTGWTEYTAARGRYIVGTPSGGTDTGTSGTALTNLESRTAGAHNHTASDSGHGHGVSDPGHLHSIAMFNSGAFAGPLIYGGNHGGFSPGNQNTAGASTGISINTGTASISVANSTGVAGTAGTPAPYIQMRYCQKTAGSDLAEWTGTNEKLTPGMIVSIDKNDAKKIVSSKVSYDETASGVVSTQPGWTLGLESKDQVQLALTGRVPTLVSTINGEIKAGDPVTSSDIPGVGMKATKPGTIIGRAMEDMKVSSNGRGSVTVLLNTTHYEPSNWMSTRNLSSLSLLGWVVVGVVFVLKRIPKLRLRVN